MLCAVSSVQFLPHLPPFLCGTPFMQRCLWPSALQKRNGLFGPMELFSAFCIFRTCSSWYTAEIGGGRRRSKLDSEAIEDELMIDIYVHSNLLFKSLKERQKETKICPHFHESLDT
jgi:hypothetical protein